MLLTLEQYEILKGTSEHQKRGIAPMYAKLWDIRIFVNGGVGKVGVPYKMDPRFSDQQKQKILTGMQEIEDETCIR